MRQKTNSMTELTKNIFKEMLEAAMPQIRNVAKSEVDCAVQSHMCDHHSPGYESVREGTGPKTGERWSRMEDQMLEASLECMISMLAVQHGRSAKAIRCRIRDKDLC